MARITGLVPNYRPHDSKNKGYGVMVAYDIQHDRPYVRLIESNSSEQVGKVGAKKKMTSVRDFIEHTILSVLRTEKQDAFSLERPLMEMGLDSADLLELHAQMSCEYHISLEPAFFFRHNTGARIILPGAAY